MPDVAPGTITDAHGWPGRWETISREDYSALIKANGGYEALGVVSSCTHPRGDNYVLTAWACRDQDYPLVQNVLEDCDPSLPSGECSGQHAFQRFIYDPACE